MEEADLLEERRDTRPRSNTWPLPEPPDFRASKPEPTTEPIDPLKQVSASEPKKSSRKNAWGNYSYADLITQAIQSSAEKRLTLSQIYDWMVNTVPYFRDKGDSNSSAGWKNSIRHNLSLHSKFQRVQNEGNGKSSWWVLNPDAKGAKTSRRRSGSLDSPQKSTDKRRGRTKKDKIKEESDRPSSPRLTVGRNFNRSGSPGNLSPTNSSSDSLLTVPELAENESPLAFPLNESFGRPRTSSNASTVSSIGRLSPIPAHDDDEFDFENSVSPSSLSTTGMTPNPAAEELTELVADGMSLEPYSIENHRIKQTLSPGSSMLQHQNCSQGEINLTPSAISANLSNGFDTSFDSGFFQPVQQAQPQQQAITQEMVPSPMSVGPQTAYNAIRVGRPAPFQSNFAPRRELNGQDGRNMLGYDPNGHRESDMEIQQAVTPQMNMYENYDPSYNNCNSNGNMSQSHVSSVCNNYDSYMQQFMVTQSNQATENFNNSSQNQLGLSSIPGQRNSNCPSQNQLEFMHEKFPSDLELDAFNGDLECDMDTIITSELNMGDGGFDFNFEQLVASVPNTPLTVGELTGRLY